MAPLALQAVKQTGTCQVIMGDAYMAAENEQPAVQHQQQAQMAHTSLHAGGKLQLGDTPAQQLPQGSGTSWRSCHHHPGHACSSGAPAHYGGCCAAV